MVRVCAVEVAVEQLTARGRLIGFSSDELVHLSFVRVGDSGGNERVQPSIGNDGRFEARFSLGIHEDQAAIRLRLVAEIRDAGWRSELGTYEMGRGREVDGIVVSK